MDRNYYEDAISFENLYLAMKHCCNNVRWKDSVAKYESDGLLKTLRLMEKLESGKYMISDYSVFKIYEPKERVIEAAAFVDRQFQQSMCASGLYEDLTEHFIRDNVSCQVGKGTKDAFNRMKILLHKYWLKHGKEGYVLKCDVHKFFPSTSHEVAKEISRKYISDDRICEKVCELIDSFGGERGIGLGSPISQLIQLSVLSPLDHYIKEVLRIKCYIRYMDDFILVHEDKEYLKFCKKKIEEKLSEIGLELNPKTTLYNLSQGVKFLNWRFLLTDSGKVLMLMSAEKVHRFKRKIKKLWSKELLGELPDGTTETAAKSFISYAEFGDTKTLVYRLKQYICEITGGTLYGRRKT